MPALRKLVVLATAAVVLAAPVAAGARPETLVQDEGAPGSFELVGHSPLDNRGMNAALAVRGDYAYVGSRTDAKANNANQAGVMVVDVSDPSAPEVVHEIGPPAEANTGETSREMRIWPEQELLIVMNLFSNCGEIHACIPVDGDDNFRFYDISGDKAAAPELVAEYVPTADPHEFFLWQDPKKPSRALMFMSTPGGGNTQLLVADISGARAGKVVELGSASIPSAGVAGGDNRLHSLAVSNDGTRAYIAHLEAGFYVADVSDFARGVKKPTMRLLTPNDAAPRWPDAEGPGVHSAVKLFGRDYVLVTDEVYGEALRPLDSGGCPWGWTKLIDIRNPAKPKVVSEYKLPQNDESFCLADPPNSNVPRSSHPFSSYAAHNPTLTKNIAFITWHSGGLQAVSIKDPKKPTQLAEFKPDPLPFVLQEDPMLSAGQDKVVMWSFPIIKDGLVYVVDVRNGLYILEYGGQFANEVAAIDFLEGNSNLGDALRFEKP